jgi:hypothetical protein
MQVSAISISTGVARINILRFRYGYVGAMDIEGNIEEVCIPEGIYHLPD